VDQELYEIITRAKKGDQEAFALLVSRFKQNIFRYAYGMLGDRMEAEDAAQEAFIKAFYSLPKLDNVYAFSSWLIRIASNLCYDRLQKLNKEHVLAAEWINTHVTQNDMQQSDLHMMVEAAIKTLSPEHREVVILRDLQGYSYEEIAEMINVPLGTVKSRISKARLLLRKEMTQNGGLS
jgi:RNA polymerase sigma-70 factor (ECF subfamily)